MREYIIPIVFWLSFSMPAYGNDVQEECRGYANLTRIIVQYRLEGVSKEKVTDIMLMEFGTPAAFQPTIDWIYGTEIPNKPLVDIVVYNHFFNECVAVGGPPK